MSILKKALKEMRSYEEVGLPTSQNSQGMGNNDSQTKDSKLVNAYKLQKVARNSQNMNNNMRMRSRAEEEENDMNINMGGGEDYPSDDEMGGMEDEMNQTSMQTMDNMDGMDDMEGMDDMDVDTEEVKNFFLDNPAPSDEEIAQYAGERGIEIDQLRDEVYSLIQSLLDIEGGVEPEDYDEDPEDDMKAMDDMDGIDDMDGMSSDEDLSADEEGVEDERQDGDRRQGDRRNKKMDTKFDFSSGVADDEFEIRSKLR